MRIVPRNWPKRMPRGDFIVRCGRCRSPVPKSRSFVDADGVVCCPREPRETERQADAENARRGRRILACR